GHKGAGVGEGGGGGPAAGQARESSGGRMSLGTTYLGMRLPNPLVVGAGPLGEDIDLVKKLEDEGAAAIVLPSLYEEEITGEQLDALFHEEAHADSCAEATSYTPEAGVAEGPEQYLDHLRRVKAAVRMPVIASLNGTTRLGWTSNARLPPDAGADAIELHLFHASSDATESGAEVERRMIEVVRDLKSHVTVPVAVKLSAQVNAFGHCGRQVDAAGADGIVMFTRFHRVDLDVHELEVVR